MRFPIIGSAILLGLFLLFKFLPKELVNRVLTLYFVLLGLLAVTSTLCPFITMVLPADWAKREVKLPSISIPYFLKVLYGALPHLGTLHSICHPFPQGLLAVIIPYFCKRPQLKMHLQIFPFGLLAVPSHVHHFITMLLPADLARWEVEQVGMSIPCFLKVIQQALAHPETLHSAFHSPSLGFLLSALTSFSFSQCCCL